MIFQPLSTLRRVALTAALLIALILSGGATRAHAEQLTQFDHLTTGYELRGFHRDMSCEYCHVNGIFKGTPRTCSGCHTPGTRQNATARPPKHIAVRDDCESCHSQYNFLPIVRMDHLLVLGTCFSCHNGVVAQGKNPGHIPSNNNCDACHTTNAFNPQRVEHTALVAAASSCRGCHTGVHAQALPRNHLPTTQPCADCHSTVSWTPARVNHTGLDNCRSCHNGTTATGTPAAHMVSALECSACHRYPAWSNVSFVHTQATWPGDHKSGLACSACHTGNSAQVNWKFPALRSGCGGCHAAEFRPQSHARSTSGLKYNVNELQNCSGACHIYTDARMLAIAKPRPAGHHKVTDGAFH
jgi:hypothetical protein